jgi:threonine/homoserine/homoserine lactone efflux protein
VFEAFGLGFSYGIGLSLMLGTVFFALIKFGLSNGYKAGLAIAAGVIASDLLFILLAFWFTNRSNELIQANQQWVLLFGGIFILLFGLIGFFTRIEPKEYKASSHQANLLKLVALGFTLNVTNPVNFFAWVAIQSILVTKAYSDVMQISFLMASLMAIGMVEVSIASISKKAGTKINGSLIYNINKGIQVLFALIGLYLIVTAILHWYT